MAETTESKNWIKISTSCRLVAGLRPATILRLEEILKKNTIQMVVMDASLNHAGITLVVCPKGESDVHTMTGLRSEDCHSMSAVMATISNVNLDTNQVPQMLSLDTHPECQLDMEVFGTTSEIEINTDGTEDVILADADSARSLECTFGVKDHVPDMVATETVITTMTHPRRRKQKLETEMILQHHETRVVSDDICVSDSADGVSLWGAAIQTDTLYLEHPCTSVSTSQFQNAAQVVEVLTSGDIRSLVPLSLDSTVRDLPVSLGMTGDLVDETSVQHRGKRERDRLKKRRIREDPTYRMMEKDKSRTRMRLKRTEPGYREKEREKDRNRRRQARQRNDEKRQRERDRDKTYKKNQRRMPINMPAAAHADVSSYSIDLVDIPNVDL